MALIDDINALPTTVGDGQTGHLANHQVIHSALKNHESRITSGTAYVDNRVPPTLALRLDTTSGTRIFAGTHMIYGDTGWRNVTDTATTGITVGTGGGIRLRRVGDRVMWSLRAITPNSASGTICPVPAGFRTDSPASTQISVGISDQQPALAQINQSHYNLQFFGTTTTSQLSAGTTDLVKVFHTAEPWPGTLPGTPA